MQPPRSIKEVQCLIGKVAAFNGFLSRLGDMCIPFFQVLKHSKNFEWTQECKEAFKKLKTYLAQLPQLISTNLGEPLSLYLAASNHAVSSILI